MRVPGDKQKKSFPPTTCRLDHLLFSFVLGARLLNNRRKLSSFPSLHPTHDGAEGGRLFCLLKEARRRERQDSQQENIDPRTPFVPSRLSSVVVVLRVSHSVKGA